MSLENVNLRKILEPKFTSFVQKSINPQNATTVTFAPQSCFSWNLLTRATPRYLIIIIIMTTSTMSTTMRTTTTNFYSLTKENHKEPYSVHCSLRIGRRFCKGVRCRLLTSQVQCWSSIITNYDTY